MRKWKFVCMTFGSELHARCREWLKTQSKYKSMSDFLSQLIQRESNAPKFPGMRQTEYRYHGKPGSSGHTTISLHQDLHEYVKEWLKNQNKYKTDVRRRKIEMAATPPGKGSHGRN